MCGRYPALLRIVRRVNIDTVHCANSLDVMNCWLVVGKHFIAIPELTLYLLGICVHVYTHFKNLTDGKVPLRGEQTEKRYRTRAPPTMTRCARTHHFSFLQTSFSINYASIYYLFSVYFGNYKIGWRSERWTSARLRYACKQNHWSV